MPYGFLADLVVAFHVGYVAFVVLGLLLILVGVWRRWDWVRNFWFRALHLAAIGYVAYEEFADIVCPLTVWENRLRELAGRPVHEGTFVGRLLHNLIFVDWPPWALTALHVGFAALVVATFVWAPPRLPFRRPAPARG